MKKLFFLVMLLMVVVWAYPADWKILAGGSRFKSTGAIGGDESEITIYPLHGEFGSGLVLGAGLEVALAPCLGLEVDALYLQKGSNLQIEAIPGLTMVRLNELSFPVLLKVYMRPGFTPFLLGGGEFAAVLTGGTKKVDYGPVGGLGFRLPLGKIRLSLEGRYYYGLQDMLTDTCVLRKMRVYTVMMGFSL